MSELQQKQYARGGLTGWTKGRVVSLVTAHEQRNTQLPTQLTKIMQSWSKACSFCYIAIFGAFVYRFSACKV